MNIYTFATDESANTDWLNGLKVGDKVVCAYRPHSLAGNGYKKLSSGVAYRVGTVESTTKAKVVISFGDHTDTFRRTDGRQSAKDTNRFPNYRYIVSIAEMNEYISAVKSTK